MHDPKLVSYGLYFGTPMMFACDAQCHKAWGVNGRPRRGDAMLADDELGEAPVDPGSYEGGHAKPLDPWPPESHNKWCVRECERSVMVELKHRVTLPAL